MLGVTAGVGCAAVVDGGNGRDKGTGWVSGLLCTRYTAVAASGRWTVCVALRAASCTLAWSTATLHRARTSRFRLSF